MTYLDQDQLNKSLSAHPVYRELTDRISYEADDYFTDFSDSPDRISRWGHHYFCRDEGGLLIYDKDSPERHVCSICGKSYSGDLLNGVWNTMYRNHGVSNAWKSALAYRVSGQQRFLDYLLKFTEFYNGHYSAFILHNKEGIDSKEPEQAPWGSSRIMPQALNESIFLVRLVNALELVKDSLSSDLINQLENGMFGQAYRIFRPQMNKIHNIPTWLGCGIGVMGLFLGNSEMSDFAFDSEYGVKNQLQQGLTADSFWYEGSIHYNHFLLEGVVNLLLFAGIYGRDFSVGRDSVSRMIRAVCRYAFDNHRLPNPNDGWPDVNLKTYSYIYSTAVKVLGEEDECARLLGAVLNHPGERATIPLAKPCYFRNDISLEEFMFVPNLRKRRRETVRFGTVNFPDTYCALLKNDSVNIFLKYGHNGPSHAHPDKMTVEVLADGGILSRDLSNAGYGNRLCNEWHRVSASHNTVVADGQSHSGFGGGTCRINDNGSLSARAADVYPGVNFYRNIRLTESGFSDEFQVRSDKVSVFDYFFHVDGKLSSDVNTVDSDLGFNANGYQHIRNVRKVVSNDKTADMDWNADGRKFRCRIEIQDAELFLTESPDNPVTRYRPGFVLRKRSADCCFRVSWQIISK